MGKNPCELAEIRILFCAPDTLQLWGIPSAMRPGQQPGDLWRARSEWRPPKPGMIGGSKPIDLGWRLLDSRDSKVADYLAARIERVPTHPGEWASMPGPGDRVQMKEKRWTGQGSRSGTIRSVSIDSVIVSFDDGTPVDVALQAIEPETESLEICEVS